MHTCTQKYKFKTATFYLLLYPNQAKPSNLSCLTSQGFILHKESLNGDFILSKQFIKVVNIYAFIGGNNYEY